MNFIKHWAVLLAAAASCTASAAPLLSEGFNDISTLPAGGWVFSNNSAPPGSTGWFQGIPTFFPAAAGPADSYIAANFNNAAFGGTVSNWLFTPELALNNGESLNFSLRLLGQGFLDRVEVYYSTSGASANVGDFSLLTAFESDTDTGWVGRSAVVNGLAAPSSGRFAFRYVVDDTSINGNYIGIDSVSVNATTIPEPGSAGLVFLGFIALVHARRKLRPARWLSLAGLSLTAMAAQAGPAGPSGAPAGDGVMTFPNVRVVAQPAPARAAPAPQGLIAYRDPATGQLVKPSPEQAAALAAASRAAAPAIKPRAARPAIVRPPLGGIGVILDERRDRYTSACKSADGVAVDCATNAPVNGEGAQK